MLENLRKRLSLESWITTIQQTYFPDVYITDRLTTQKVRVPASVAAISALGYNDKVAYPWFAPAGFNRGGLSMVSNTDVRLTAGDRDELYDARINPIANFSNGDFVIFGQKTCQLTKSALDRVNVPPDASGS